MPKERPPDVITTEWLAKRAKYVGWSEALNSLVSLRSEGVMSEHRKVLESTATLEHELGFIPHNDQDVENACPVWECRTKRLPKPPGGNGGGSPIFTPNELRQLRPPPLQADMSIVVKTWK